MRTRVLTILAGLLPALALALLAAPAPQAVADGRVTVGNESGQARIDPTYATTLTVRGNGFQSIKGGHGGVYVFFGTVSNGWRPSQGGATGSDYFYVPDSESRDNQGFQKYVAFPGSDTASSANGGTMSASGAWSTTITVPGAVFSAQDRSGSARTIDCRRVTCGIITVGAHGVVNSSNESFTPVSVGDLYGGEAPPAAASADAAPEAAPQTAEQAPVPDAKPGRRGAGAGPTAQGPVVLEVDRASARAGHVLAFTASGLAAGSQVSAVLDDGVAGAGPFLVGADGRLGGVITIPVDVAAGTHELRLFGAEGEEPSVNFAITGASSATTVAAGSPPEDQAEASVALSDSDRAGVLFLVGSASALLLVVIFVVRRRRGGGARAAA